MVKEIWRTPLFRSGISKTQVTGRVAFEISAVNFLTTFARVKIFPGGYERMDKYLGGLSRKIRSNSSNIIQIIEGS